MRSSSRLTVPAFLVVGGWVSVCQGWLMPQSHRTPTRRIPSRIGELSNDYLENDLVAVQSPSSEKPRLCVVRPDSTVAPLCQHEDDVETDLFLDPREDDEKFWAEASDDDLRGTYGEGWYGQRPVPSLGGGPGYGADASEIWSVDEPLLEKLAEDGVDLPILDVGIAHGEKARGGAY